MANFDQVDRYLRWARSRIGLRPEVADEIASGVPCPCCQVKLRPLFLQSVAQVVAQRIFLLHVQECGCGEKGFMGCETAVALFRGLPPEFQNSVMGPKV